MHSMHDGSAKKVGRGMCAVLKSRIKSPREGQKQKQPLISKQQTVKVDVSEIGLSPYVEVHPTAVEERMGELRGGIKSPLRKSEVIDVVTADARQLDSLRFILTSLEFSSTYVVVDVEHAQTVSALQQLHKGQQYEVKTRRHVRQEQHELIMNALDEEWQQCKHVFKLTHTKECYAVPFNQISVENDDLRATLVQPCAKLMHAGLLHPLVCPFEGHVLSDGRVRLREASFVVEASRRVTLQRYVQNKTPYEEKILVYPCQDCKKYARPCMWAKEHAAWSDFGKHHPRENVSVNHAALLLTLLHYSDLLSALKSATGRRASMQSSVMRYEQIKEEENGEEGPGTSKGKRRREASVEGIDVEAPPSDEEDWA